MKLQSRVTLRDIARVTGVSHVTVSLALREHPSIPATTRDRIKAQARRMGYAPDPVLGALNAYRHGHRPPSYQATLGWINAYQDRTELRRHPTYDLYWRGAEAKAKEMGYRLEEFWINEPGMKGKTLGRVLRARQIPGLLLPPMPGESFKLELPWNDFSIVAFGYSHDPAFHLVTSAQYRNSRIAVHRLVEKGYKRIGLLTSKPLEQRTDMNFASGFLAECQYRGSKPFVLQLARDEYGEELMRRLPGWIKRCRPEVILAFDASIISILHSLNFRVPRDIGVVLLNRHDGHKGVAGVDQNSLQVGRAAVEQLARLLQQNERGKPYCPLRILIDGKWIEGSSAPTRKPSTPQKRNLRT